MTAVDDIHADAARRTRESLALGPSDELCLLLPPVAREAGAFTATWALFLLHKVRPAARLIVPGTGREVDRIRRLAESCNHETLVRFTGDRLELMDLLAAADIAVFLPRADASLTGVRAALAFATPIVASDVRAVRELLRNGHNARLCRPDSPRDATRRMLDALEQPEESKRLADVGRSEIRGPLAPD
jgi:glycosyltransferase involved in cell wall biosynthesis